jgi:TRAP-type C4-dicarboxylate transport system substrate-binding protein
MSKARYESLPADLRAVIDEVSADLLDVCIEYTESEQNDAYNEISEINPNFKKVEIEDMQSFIDTATPVIQAKADELDANGYDGAGAYKWLQEHAVQ